MIRDVVALGLLGALYARVGWVAQSPEMTKLLILTWCTAVTLVVLR